MRPGSVLVDVAIDQGGCFETSKADHPCRAHLRGGRHRALLRGQYARRGAAYLHLCAEQRHPAVLHRAWPTRAPAQAMLDDPHLIAGLNVHRGMVTYEEVARDLGYDYVDARVAPWQTE